MSVNKQMKNSFNTDNSKPTDRSQLAMQKMKTPFQSPNDSPVVKKRNMMCQKVLEISIGEKLKHLQLEESVEEEESNLLTLGVSYGKDIKNTQKHQLVPGNICMDGSNVEMHSKHARGYSLSAVSDIENASDKHDSKIGFLIKRVSNDGDSDGSGENSQGRRSSLDSCLRSASASNLIPDAQGLLCVNDFTVTKRTPPPSPRVRKSKDFLHNSQGQMQ